MKKLITMIVCLALASLACLEPAVIPAGNVHPVATRSNLTTATSTPITVAPVVKAVATSPAVCARVIADEAVNLRDNAGAGGSVLAWLRKGEDVSVIGSTAGAWWLVGASYEMGYVRADYLQIVECVK